MADNKYGRLFTEDDAKQLVAAAVYAGIELGEDASDGGNSARDFDTNAIFDAVVTGFTPKFPEDEPLFLLLGRDESAAATIDDYWGHSTEDGATGDHLVSVGKAYSDFVKFKIDHPDRVKVAD